jgi:hypothetical protein
MKQEGSGDPGLFTMTRTLSLIALGIVLLLVRQLERRTWITARHSFELRWRQTSQTSVALALTR